MMKVTSVISTKGGTGKTTTTVNLGALCADAGIRTLLIDLDPVQPSCSSYYPLIHEAPGGIFELLAHNVTASERVISRTAIPNLDVIVSNDVNNQLHNLLLQAPDGRLRLANLLPAFQDQYDLVLIDSQGARSVVLEMIVLASSLAVSPLPPNMLTAREFHRGTVQMLEGLSLYGRMGMPTPLVKIVVNGLDQTADARRIHELVTSFFDGNKSIEVIGSTIPSAVVFRNAASQGVPAHRLEYRQPSNRQSPAALQILRELAIELFPEWQSQFETLTEAAVAQLSKEGL